MGRSNASAMSSLENLRYNDEVCSLDSMYGFHPKAFAKLTRSEQEALGDYYLVGRPTPENIFLYRKDILARDPELEARANAAYLKIRRLISFGDY